MGSKRPCAAAMVLLSLGVAPSALAQTPTAMPEVGAGILPTPQQLNPAGEARARAPRRERDILAPPERGACPLASSDLSFTLSSVSFRGGGAVDAKALARAYAGLIGRTIKVAEICGIRDRAAEIIFGRGYLARVEIPEQRISDGRLVLDIVEARIASVRVRGNAGAAQSKVEDYIERLRGLTPFDLRTAQRYLLLAADVPGVRLSAALRPSPQGRGAVDLEVTVSRDSADLMLNVQNLGSQSQGPWGGVLRADLNGFTRLGERTTLVLYSTLFDDEQQVVQWLEEARFGSSGWIGRASVAYGRSRPGAELKALDLDGRSLVGTVQLGYPLVRARRTNLNASTGLEIVNQTIDFSTGDKLNDDRLRIVYGRLDGEARRQVMGLPTDLRLTVEARQGLSALGASPPGQPFLSRIEGRSDALVARLNGRIEQQWTRFASAQVAFQAQYANRPLLAYEEMPVGNLTVGRGYDPSILSGDRGLGAGAELRLGPFAPVRWGAAQVYGFYDVAHVSNLDVGGENRTVRSLGGGLRIRLTARASLDVAYAEPLDRVSINAPGKPPPRVLVNLVTTFF